MDTTICVLVASLGFLGLGAWLYWRAVVARREAKAFLSEAFRALQAELKTPSLPPDEPWRGGETRELQQQQQQQQE